MKLISQTELFTLHRSVIIPIFGLIFALSVMAFLEYSGQGFVYILFTIVSNALLCFGFRKKAIFFDTFVGIFLWLGFWLKSSIRIAFMHGQFHEAVGMFDGSGGSFDQALLVSSCGMLGLLAASIVRERFIFNYPDKLIGTALTGLYKFYRDYRILVLSTFVVLVVGVAFTNAYFGIYQRGAVPRTILPFGLNGVYSWLLLFGLASFTALILHFEFEMNKKTSYLVAMLGLLESFLSNVSLLSRGMVLNASALAYGVFRSLKINSIQSSFRFLVISFTVFIVLFGSSVLLVNHLRVSTGYKESVQIQDIAKHNDSNQLKILFLDRWVGIEGVMAVSSYPELGWGLWGKAWKETFSYDQTTFFDLNIITTPYQNVDSTKHHYISLPGILAFCFYPGSFIFLFGCMLILGLLAALIEMSVYKLGGKNIVLCALLAQVVAYRYAHFGYVPMQSYKLFGTIYLNLFIIYFSDKFLLFWHGRK